MSYGHMVVSVLSRVVPSRCDLQVCSSGTAANNLAIVLKQLNTIKVPTWDELADMTRTLCIQCIHKIRHNIMRLLNRLRSRMLSLCMSLTEHTLCGPT